MNKLRVFILLITFGCLATSCDDLLEPPHNNFHDRSRILRDAPFAEGILLTAYGGLRASNELAAAATDDAVSNDRGSEFTRMATGQWSSRFNPLGAWGHAYEQLFYLNYFLFVVDDVEWSWESDIRNELFRKRFTGEAKALRAWYNFELLKKHGGLSSSGQALGFVIIRPEYTSGGDHDVLMALPRDSYEDCVQFILNDIEEAISLLPDRYENVADDLDYNRVFGEQNKNRVDGQAVKALKARLLLHVASQSFYDNAAKWASAADAAATLLVQNGGVGGLSPTGTEWYKDRNDPDIIWRENFESTNTLEMENFPPSLFGNGRVNPSQNLVDAFPMANGYPIDDAASGYDPDSPYVGRDPRLQAYVVFNGNSIGSQPVFTQVEDEKDGINTNESSTRTGYYLKKLLREDVNLDPNVMSTQPHFNTLFRFTEMYLIYAEAANEAWGPDADPNGYGFAARDVIAAIRRRAGISQPDEYLNTAASSREALRELIRNERRLELCFEGFRFWDIRRWGLDLNETARGMQISNNEHVIIDVESRSYGSSMFYGPIPYDEILKNQNLEQNAGW